MLILDIFVIYLACGAPFAAARFLRREAQSGLGHVLTSFGAFMYWPVLLPSFIRRMSGSGVSQMNSPNYARSDSTESRLRSVLVDEWSMAFGTVELVTFRNILERYAALSIELQAGRVSAGVNELSSIAGHPDPELHYVCLMRRNRERLALNRTNARSEFIESVDRLASVGGFEIMRIAWELAEAVGDDEALAELATCSPYADRSAAAAW